MQYIPSIRVGIHDIKALVNLETERRTNVIPLLNMRGTSTSPRHLDTFLNNWLDGPFFLDISPYLADKHDAFIVSNLLNLPAEAYKARRLFYKETADKNSNVIPVISWQSSAPPREVIQCALALERTHTTIAIRTALVGDSAPHQSAQLLNILNALGDPSRAWILLDQGPIARTDDLANSSPLTTMLEHLRPLHLAGISVISTSFPDSRPANGSIRTVPCLDLAAQTRVNNLTFATPLTYGDYAATYPSSSMEFIPGMQVIPFANYFAKSEWWQTRRGADKEFAAYVDIAREICELPDFHGADFCWGTAEINRIANKIGGTGNNGTWNGIRINQHICSMLDHLKEVGYPASAPFQDDEDTDETSGL
jgi:hypothetical protein